MKISRLGLVILFSPLISLSQAQNNIAKPNWRIEKPFEQNVFIENNEGQFDNSIDSGKVLFCVPIDGITILFTSTGIRYRHDEITILKGEEREAQERDNDEEREQKSIIHYLISEWMGANPQSQVIPEDEVPFYYCYPINNKHTVIAHAYKKLLYKNVYSGIDIEYSFPKNDNGIEYSIIVHPNADISNLKLVYKNAQGIFKDAQGNIIIESSFGQFIENCSSFSEIDSNTCNSLTNTNIPGIPVKSSFSVNKNEINFTIGKYNKNKILTSTNWTTDPAFTNYDAAYDLRYDLKGNIYAFGNGNPTQNGLFQLIKINSSGVIQWIFTSTYEQGFGDLAVDEKSGTCYISGGFGGVTKIDTLGIQTNSIGTGNNEIWRMGFDNCTDQIIIGGGGTSTIWQGAILDTNFSSLNMINFLGATLPTHDIALLAIDQGNGYCYMSAAKSLVDDPNNFNNFLSKCPIPNLTPLAFSTSDGYSFSEITSVKYVGDNYLGTTNGFNGMVVSSNWLYLYDGSTLRRFDKNSGALVKSKQITDNSFDWGGLDVDLCDNIYVGNATNIEEYDSDFQLINSFSTTATSDTIYDVRLGPNNYLYACGKGFISSYILTNSALTLNKISTPSCSNCNGTALVNLSICGKDTVSYLWSTGQTTQFITGLCPGTYTVTISFNCEAKFIDTFNIDSTSNPAVNIPTSRVINVSCYGGQNGSATAIASGGTSPYSYIWYPSDNTNQAIGNVIAGTYTVITVDSLGCGALDTVTIMQPSDLNLSATSNISISIGQDSTLIANATGGTPPYTYTWDGNSNGSSYKVSPLVTTTYTVLVTDSNGCTAIQFVTVEVLCGNLFIPNGFSPNNDGHNDILYVRDDCIKEMDFIIFDRWGNKVFESENLDEGWDGTYKGQPMNIGTFVWYLKATLQDGTRIEKKGNVALVR